MKISKGKTLAEEIYSTVTPDVMKTIEATEAHKEQSDKVNKELDKKSEDFVKDTEKVNKEVKSIMKKKLHMSESLEEDTEEYVDEFTDVYREIVNNFPDNQRKSSFVRDETFGIIRIYSDDPDEQRSISDMAKKHRGVTTEIKDGYVEVVAPTRRKASSSKTYHDLFDEVYAQLTADGDKYDVWGKFSDNIGAGYAVNQIGSVGGSDENTITVTVDPDKAAQAKAERTRYISTLDPAIEVVKRYKEDGVTYSQRKDGEADVLVITVPNKKASMKDVRVTYDETGRPVANKRSRSGENKGYFDKETIDTTQKGYLKKFRDLRNKGYEVVHTDEKIIYMVAPKKKDKVNESKKLTEDNYGWQVKPGEEWDLYEELCEAWGEDDVNKQIVQAMGTDELGEYLEFICRMNDFDSVHFEGHEDDEEDEDDTNESLKEEAKKSKYAVKHENGKYVSKDYNVGSFDRAATFETEEEAETFISDNGKDKTWKDHYTIVDISKDEGKRTKDDPWGLLK